MVRPASEFEFDPAVVPIADPAAVTTMDEWLALLKNGDDGSTNVSGVELVTQSRAESE